ncbi:hypothetical protein SISNIDRAFT_451434 [Sistotremastrum niveocremeum HHB9708]|uniref:F-box domain-containing protein n=2 Tax=Sistotremastraceae TaxID=3402574 RepID=A0A164XB82_9AGAM|nr:hypothetical protein SISNIDRAFT_451434 [Sistotremastrum niveocremeum HHB9708]KZT35619.1 hypothetical protein SISSUDRAFT_1051102 [Sistotremastrum suecicum HHB10207 ss-3]
MPLSAIPVELLSRILKDALLDIDVMQGPKKRLKYTARLALINRQTRAVALANAEIWSTIYLQWPYSAVTEYFERAKRSNICLYLDTYQSVDAATADINIQNWAFFLQTNMGTFTHMDLHIRSADDAEALSEALEAPAPNLQSFRLRLYQIPVSWDLFSSTAPKLETAYLDTCRTWDVSPFLALSTLTLRVCQTNCRRSLSVLQRTPHLKNITLIGTGNATDVPSPQEPHTVVFPSCHHFDVKNMKSVSVRRLMSTIKLPALVALAIHESVALLPFLPTVLAEHLAPANGLLVSPTRLSVELYPNSLIIETNGTPSIRQTTDWHDVHKLQSLPRFQIHNAVVNMIASISSVLLTMAPPHVAILNKIDHTRFRASNEPALVALDQYMVFKDVFIAYPQIETVELAGYVGRAAYALLVDGLPSLHAVDIKYIMPGSRVPVDDLRELEHKRNVVLRLELQR